MASVNKVILVGHLGRDPEVRYMPNGEAVCNFSLATTDQWKDKNGQRKERTEWHNIIAYRKAAELLGEYLKKGSAVYLEGRSQTRKWQTKEGQDRYTTEIVVSDFQFLGGKPNDGQASDSGQSHDSQYHSSQDNRTSRQQPQQRQAQGNFDDFDDDIPF